MENNAVEARSVQTIVRTDLGPWAEAWDALVDGLRLPSPFLRSWWIDHTTVGRPAVVLVISGDRLLGGAAFQIRHVRRVDRIEMAGQGPLEPDHLDLVSANADVPVVQAALRAWLGSVGGEIVLDGLVDGAALLGALPGLRRAKVSAVAPYAPLPGSAADYFAGRGGRTRSTITRTDKRLRAAGVTDRSSTGQDVESAIASLTRLHDARWGEASALDQAWASFENAARAGAAAGEVWFHELVGPDGLTIAVEVDFFVAGRFSFYQAGRLPDHDWRGSGSVLKARVIEHAVALGASEYDLLRGDEPYKTEWASAERPLVSVRSGTGVRGIAAFLGAQVAAAIAARRAAASESGDPTED